MQSTDRKKNSQLLALLTQSFEIFNVYGKEPEAVRSILHGYAVVLEPYAIDDITAAFKAWMQNKSTFPTPAEIRMLTLDAQAIRCRKPGSGAGKPKWIMEIRDLQTDELLESHEDGKHVAPIDLWKKYGDRGTRRHMRRDPPLSSLQGE